MSGVVRAISGVLGGLVLVSVMALGGSLACFNDLMTGESASSSSTGDPTTTTGAEMCAGIGEVCTPNGGCCGCGLCVSGVCQDSDALCGDCATCEAGQCKALTPGSPCGDELECKDFVFGVDAGICYAGAGTVRGVCGQGSKCLDATSSSCLAKGAELFVCGACLRADHLCTKGTAVSQLGLADVCAVDVQVETCKDVCSDDGLSVVLRRCDAQGMCVEELPMDSGNYLCALTLAGPTCPGSCMVNEECELGSTCMSGECVMM